MRNYENERELTRALLDFLEKSPTSFHAVEQMEARLRKEGFEELREEDSWKLEEGGKYYVIRSMSSLIAFRIPGTDFGGYQIMASHSDSPAFKLKENPEMEAEQAYDPAARIPPEGVVYQPGQPVPELDQWNDLRAVMGDDGVLRIFKEKNSDDFC